MQNSRFRNAKTQLPLFNGIIFTIEQVKRKIITLCYYLKNACKSNL